MNKSSRLHVLVTPADKQKFEAAASAEGLTLSAWVLRTLTLAAKNGTKAAHERETETVSGETKAG